MQDMQDVTQEMHYENYRSERLAKGAPVPKRTTYVSFEKILFDDFQSDFCQVESVVKASLRICTSALTSDG